MKWGVILIFLILLATTFGFIPYQSVFANQTGFQSFVLANTTVSLTKHFNWVDNDNVTVVLNTSVFYSAMLKNITLYYNSTSDSSIWIGCVPYYENGSRIGTSTYGFTRIRLYGEIDILWALESVANELIGLKYISKGDILAYKLYFVPDEGSGIGESIAVTIIMYSSIVRSSGSTLVGGIIWGNTTWTLENSPYIITDTVQIPENVTLTIEPGVTVTGSGNMFLVHGRIYAHGTIDEKIIFTGGQPLFNVDGSGPDAFVDLDYCTIKNGGSFWWDGHGHFNLTRSELINLASYSYVWYPGRDVYIEYNKFINTAGFSIGHSAANVYIRYNLFKGNRGFVVKNWASYSASQTVVKYNSFIDMDGIVLELPSGYDSAAMTATENYWGTQDTDVIDQMIYDRNDDIMCPNFIDYLPILSKPHHATPIMLEDVKVGIDGIFRKDDDGKWRCYANITIKNNSYRNVTIRWVYLNAINITYIDETFEELNISGNETLNYVIQSEQELSVNWNITAFGFTKEPKILWVLFKTPISEAYGTITLTTVILEFPSFLILALFMIAILLAVIVYRRKRVLA